MIAWAATLNTSFASLWSSSKKSVNFGFAGLKTNRWNLCFAVPLTGVLRTFYGTQSGFLPKFLCWVCWCFWTSAKHHHAWEIGNSVFCLLPWVGCDFLDFFGQSFKKFQFFSIKSRCCCNEGLGQFRYSVNVVVETGRITMTCQLLKGKQNLLCFNCRRGVLTAKLWMTCGARLLLFSWRSSRAAVRNLFFNFCHYVRGLFRVWVS